MPVNEKMTAIADAIRGKTGGTSALTLDQMAAEIASIETGGSGGSMEKGEFVGTTSTHWVFTVPVSSKKTHLLILPKSFDNMWSQDNTSRERLFVAVEGIGHILATPGNPTDATEIVNGASRWYFANGSGNTVTFSDTAIDVVMQYSPWAIGDYLWFAW